MSFVITKAAAIARCQLKTVLLCSSAFMVAACTSSHPPSWVQQPELNHSNSESACAPAAPDGKTLALLRAKAQLGQRNMVQQHTRLNRRSEQTSGTEQLSWQQQQVNQQNRFGTVPARLQQTHWQGQWQQQQMHCVLLSLKTEDEHEALRP